MSYTKNRMEWYLYPKLHRVAKFPLHVDIEICNRCNMHCPMCFRPRIKVGEGLMDFSLFKKIIDECAENKVYSIKLSWRGEPLIHPDIAKMIKYAKDKGIKEVAFLTNALALTEKRAEELVDAGTDWITVSFDGLGEVYESIRKPAKFEEAVERVKNLKKVRDQKDRKKPLIRVQTIWSAIKNDPAAYKELWTPIVDKVQFIPDKDYFSEVVHDPKFVCQYLWQRVTITWDGKVTQCIGDTNEENPIGDVNKQSIKEIWHSDVMKKRRELHLAGERLKILCCKKCPEGRIETVKDGEHIKKEMGNIRNI